MVNVDRAHGSGRYVSGTEGAPPLPPPGGYRGARRSSGPVLPSGAPAPAAVAEDASAPRSRSWLGWTALIITAVFALVLLGFLAVGGGEAFFTVDMLAVQLLVLGLVVAALLVRRSRAVGAIALAVALVFNVGTVGAIGAVRVAQTGAYPDTKTDEQRHMLAYPGIKGMSESAILARPTLEELRAEGKSLLAEVRTELSAKFGFTWAAPVPEALTPTRNGYGGESMLSDMRSETWTTNEPIHDLAQKHAVMAAIQDILARRGLSQLYPLNDPQQSSLDRSLLQKLFGDTDPDRQAQWEWYAYDYEVDGDFYADLYDLSRDSTGKFTASRDAAHQRTGEPAEGLQLVLLTGPALKEADVDKFTDRMKDYP
ncbi:hypothetical protein [Microbacterium gorillae]|uniref:hypothetical protein n=1 Tax=Microbacterium gorillae TaxID=1231063 RepID=UPI00058CEA28|nr:hypothetical protein [Microbacterium gorillae]